MDINKIMASLGMESYTDEPKLTEEQEMLNEIALESELDVAFAEMEAANIVSVISDVESINYGLAEREIALESNVGRDVATIMGEFGLEAIKDVAARHAYSGMASIKALINKVIAWLKNLLGMGTTLKKVCTGLKKKIDTQIKALRKLAGKDMSKLKRDLPEISDMNKKAVVSPVDKLVDKIAAAKDIAQELPNIIKGGKTGAANLTAIESEITAADDVLEKIKDGFKEWKDNTSEYEGTGCYNHIMKALEELKKFCEAHKNSKVEDDIKKTIKTLEKARADVNENAAGAKDGSGAANAGKALNKLVVLLNKSLLISKASTKAIVQTADEILTHAKWLEAAL